MKYYNILFLFYFPVFLYGQSATFSALLDSGKAAFKAANQTDSADFRPSVDLLRQAVALQPDHAEARYFLGYALSRLNSGGAASIPQIQIGLTRQCSEQFERVVALDPHYTGEQLVLGPYAKISSEWGAQAMCYLNRQLHDSAVWALKEGRARGGFSDFGLASFRELLTMCSDNAILLTYGDHPLFLLMYLQYVEHLRTDVNVMDVSMLYLPWYTKMLARDPRIDWGMTENERDSLHDSVWRDSTIQLTKNFSATIKSNYSGGGYLLRNGKILLKLFQTNLGKRDFYVSSGFNNTELIGLDTYLEDWIWGRKLNISTSDKSDIPYNKILKKVSRNADLINVYCDSQTELFNSYRISILIKIYELENSGKHQDAKMFFQMYEHYLANHKIPYLREQIAENVEELRKYLEQF